MNGYVGNNSYNYWWDRKSLKVPAMLYDRFAMQPDIRNAYAMSESIADGVVVRGYAVQKENVGDRQRCKPEQCGEICIGASFRRCCGYNV